VPRSQRGNPIAHHHLRDSRSATSRRIRRTAAAAATAAFALSLTACADTFRSASSSPAALAGRVDQLFEALSARFTSNELSPRYDVVRKRLGQGALTPSRVFSDSAIWDARPSPSRREIFVQGYLATDGHYYLDQRPSLAPPTHLGETRHAISLEQLDKNVYRWNTRVDMGIGTLTAEDASDIWNALLTGAQNRGERELRDDYRAAFPRAMTAFGRGFSLDTARTSPGVSGSTNVALTFSFRPELMRPAFPALADYVDKYLGPAKYHFVLSERGGGVLFDAIGRDRHVTLTYRVQQGKLVTLLGAPRPWGDTLLLDADVSLKVKMFTVGFHKLTTDFVISNSGHERAWTIVAQREPEWDLPLITERVIRSPLRRPFEGQGAMFRVGIRDTTGALTEFSRAARLDVQESAIMRFIGSLASHILGDIDTRVENEEHRFLRDGFIALEQDLGRLRGGGREE